MSGRVVRIFLSSTFRDFGEERDLLVRKVFPTLRARLQSRFVDLVDVDLRWGITEEEAEHGEVLPICLAEIDRARPYFIGFLGERYGWVPPRDAYPSHVLESQTWLEEHRGGKSVTELEILHGVLNNPHMEGRALFYFRSFEYSSSKGGDYISSSPDDETRQSTLKQTIRQSGFPVYEDYKSPEHLAELLEKDLWEILDREFPASDIPDAFVRENLQHEAYALPRQRLYIGGDKYLTALDKALSEGKQSILVDGPSGGGKSALLANWLKSVPERYSNMEVHAHYLGATANATDPVFMVRRLIECIKRKTESTEDLASDPDELLDSLPTWLANASSWCELRDKKFLFVIDALNSLSDRRDLRWFPRMLPKHIHLVISTLPGEVNDALQERANWSHVTVMPLDATTAELVFTSYLSLFNKTLPNELVEQVMAHKLSANPLFLLTLAEELRLFGEHEQLSNRLDHYLTSITVDDLFERVLERIEQDYGADMLREILTALWAARSGLREEEILGYSGLKPMHWAYIRNALGPTLIDASGRLIFAHDYMRIAVSDRYMAGNNTIGNEGQSEEALNLRRSAHTKLANWFEKYAFQDGQSTVSNERAAEEIPYQYQQAHDWQKLQSTLTKQTMLIAILKHRSEQELLSYWLKLEEHLKTDIETQYEKAWIKWKLEEIDELTGDIAGVLAAFLQFSGRYNAFTESLFTLHTSCFEKIHGFNHLKTSNSLQKLSYFLKEKGDYNRAEVLAQRCVTIREQALGQENLDVGSALNLLAIILFEKGDYAAAIVQYERALDIAEALVGSDSEEVANLLNNLALARSKVKDYDIAMRVNKRALILHEQLFGENHYQTGIPRHNLAILHADREEYHEAEKLLTHSLSIFKSYLGLNHQATSFILNSLGYVASCKGEHDAAENFYESALKIREQAFPQGHPSIAVSLNNLAELYSETGRTKQATHFYQRALAMTVKFFGSEHPHTALARSELADHLIKNGDQIEAEALYQAALKVIARGADADRKIVARVTSNLAYCLAEQGKYQQAIRHYSSALEIKEKIPDIEPVSLIKTINSLAQCQMEIGSYLEAAELFKRIIEIQGSIQVLDHIQLITTLKDLANCYVQLNDYSEAEPMYRRALELSEKLYGPDHPETAHAVHQLGVSLRNLDQLQEALKLLQSSYQKHEKLFGTNTMQVSSSLSALGHTQFLLKDYVAAESNYLRALQIRKNHLFDDHPGVVMLETRLSELKAAKTS